MSGRRIGILGLARSGRAAALLALSAGERVFASDAGTSTAALAAAEAVEMAGGEVELGGHTAERLAECELLVVSPGVPPTAPVLSDPRLAGVPRISELEFAFCHLRSPVIAITGTNGKSTTTALAAHLLRAAGLHAVAAGNIGLALSEVALYEKAPDWVVVEASSFQLAGTESFAPRVGVVTNLAPDHLDRYASVDAYYADKARLFKNSTDESAWVLNGEDAAVLSLPGAALGRRYLFRTHSRPARGELGAFLANGVLAMRLESWDLPLLRADELRLLGEHNVANALAASLAAALAGAPVVAIRDGLRSFRGLEHRLEIVGEWDGVLWVNDSKATNVASTLVALRSVQRPLVLLLGGRHKGEPYTSMIAELRDRARLVIAYGEAAPLIERDLKRAVRVERIDGSFEDVVEQASILAHPGDAVLLSPACSSFDMFSSYEERGRRFKELARQVAEVRHGG